MAAQGQHGRRGHAGFGKGEGFISQRLQVGGGAAAGSQKNAVAGVFVMHQHGLGGVGQPIGQHSVGKGGVCFNIIYQQIAVMLGEVAAQPGGGPQVAVKHFNTQGEIQQVAFQAKFAKAVNAGLGVVKGGPAGGIARQRGGQAGAHLGVRQAYERGLVEIVKNLAHEAGQRDGERHHIGVKIAFPEQRINGLAQVILGLLNIQKNGPGVRAAKTAGNCAQRPEQVNHAGSQAVEGENINRPPAGRIGYGNHAREGLARVRLGTSPQNTAAGMLAKSHCRSFSTTWVVLPVPAGPVRKVTGIAGCQS